MVFLDEKALGEIGMRVFRDRSSTLEDEGQSVELPTLIDTVIHVRKRMQAVLDTLPDTAFERQPDDSDGNEVWSAGQIVSHICASQRNITDTMSRVVDFTDEPDTSELDPNAMLDRSDSVTALDTATNVLHDTLHAIPEDADPTRAIEHERFGTLSLRACLMLVAIHERDHVAQLQSLDVR